MPHSQELEPLKPGYKQTEVGVIPEEWDVQQMSVLTGLPIQNGVFNEPARKGKGCRLINVGDLYKTVPVDLESLELFDANKDEILRFGVSHGDIFFTRSSLTPDGIAHCNICEKSQRESVLFDCHIIRVRSNETKVDPFFLFRYCSNASARKYLVTHAKTTTMTTIDQTVIANLPVPLPPLSEQRAIATALGDVDALIGALDRLIAKKRDLKQAAMQQLLPGQTRLPGFRGEWEIRSLLSAVTPAAGQVDPKHAPYGSMVLIAPDHVECETGKLIEKRTASEQGAISGKYVFNPGDIVYSKIRPYLRKAILADFHGLCSADMYPLTPAKDVYPAFVFAVLLGHHFSTFAMTVSVRSGIPKINREELAQYSFALPPLPEQTAIAAVLSDMDAEIAALETRRDKTRLLKQGMMQELLTGKTRLV